MIDLDRIRAIDIHVHTERGRDGHDPMPPVLREAAAKYFKTDFTGDALPTVDDVAAYYRERDIAAVVFTVDWELESGSGTDRERGDRRGRARVLRRR